MYSRVLGKILAALLAAGLLICTVSVLSAEEGSEPLSNPPSGTEEVWGSDPGSMLRQARGRLGGDAPLEQVSPLAPNPIVPDGQLGEFRHGTWPSLGVGDGNWTHVGVDLVGPCGSQVRAFAAGRVVDVISDPNDQDFDDLGYMVLIEHSKELLGRPLYTLYLHLREPPVAAKDGTVAAGQRIGRVGSTGNADGCHTHFEARYFPERFFPAWGNIYGRGDQRHSQALADSWMDPLALFSKQSEGPSPAPVASPIVEPPTSQPVQTPSRPEEAMTLAPQRHEAAGASAASAPAQHVTRDQAGGSRSISPSVQQTGGATIRATGSCDNPKDVAILTSVGAIVIYNQRHVLVTNPESVELPEGHTLCKHLPLGLNVSLAEPVALLEDLEDIARICQESVDWDCLESAFALADVTGNGELTVAEISRVLRGSSFFVAYATIAERKEGGSVNLHDIYAAMLLTNIIGPFFASGVIDSYDFDGNNSLSLTELLQDRTDDEMLGALAALQAAAVDSTAKGLLQGFAVILQAGLGLAGAF